MVAAESAHQSYERDENEGRASERRRQIIDSLEFQKKRESKKVVGALLKTSGKKCKICGEEGHWAINQDSNGYDCPAMNRNPSEELKKKAAEVLVKRKECLKQKGRPPRK